MAEGDTGSIGGEAQARREVDELTATIEEQLEELRGYAEGAGEWLREFARERPLTAVAIAAGLGFLAGRLLSRS